LGRSVDLGKDFIGRDALLHRRRLADLPVRVGLVSGGKRAAREKDQLLGAEGSEIGFVTSGTMSPTLNHPVAMAYLRPDMAVVGTRVSALVRGREEPYTVARLPFYKRQAK
jgi:aminomethyltransferase